MEWGLSRVVSGGFCFRSGCDPVATLGNLVPVRRPRSAPRRQDAKTPGLWPVRSSVTICGSHIELIRIASTREARPEPFRLCGKAPDRRNGRLGQRFIILAPWRLGVERERCARSAGGSDVVLTRVLGCWSHEAPTVASGKTSSSSGPELHKDWHRVSRRRWGHDPCGD